MVPRAFCSRTKKDPGYPPVVVFFVVLLISKRILLKSLNNEDTFTPTGHGKQAA